MQRFKDSRRYVDYDPEVIVAEYLDTSREEDLSYLFYKCSNLSTTNLDTIQVANFESMFEGCKNLISAPSTNTTKGTRGFGMFKNCKSLKTVPAFNFSNMRVTSEMFCNCIDLEAIPPLDLRKVCLADKMFSNCKLLYEIPQLSLYCKS